MAIGPPPRLLGEILVAEGLTTADAVDRALARRRTTGELIGEALVARGAVNEDAVARALAVQQDLPYVWREELPSTVPVLKTVSAKYLRQYRVCPISIEGGVLTVASADPLNAIVEDDLRQATGLSVKFVVSSATGILETIDRNYDGANASALQRIVEGIDEERAPEGDEDVNHRRDMAFEAPVVRLVNLLVENAITAEASDIHIEPFEDTLRIRYRIDGILYDQEAPPRRLQAAVTSRIKIMAEMDIARRGAPPEGRNPGARRGPPGATPGVAHPPGSRRKDRPPSPGPARGFFPPRTVGASPRRPSPVTSSSRRSTPTTRPAPSRGCKTWGSSPICSRPCSRACSPSGSCAGSARCAACPKWHRPPTSRPWRSTPTPTPSSSGGA